MINFEKEHKTNRLVVIVFAILCTIVIGSVTFVFYDTYTKAKESLYVLVDGNALQQAMRRNTMDNRPVEMRNHIRTFMSYLFTFNPDRSSINNNIKKALELSDESVKNFIDNLTEQKYYDKAISGNISHELTLDTSSIKLDLSGYPYKVTVIGEIQLVRSSKIEIRELICTMDIRNLPNRTDNNPHGLIIEKFFVQQNEKIKEFNRDQHEK